VKINVNMIRKFIFDSTEIIIGLGNYCEC